METRKLKKSGKERRIPSRNKGDPRFRSSPLRILVEPQTRTKRTTKDGTKFIWAFYCIITSLCDHSEASFDLLNI